MKSTKLSLAAQFYKRCLQSVNLLLGIFLYKKAIFQKKRKELLKPSTDNTMKKAQIFHNFAKVFYGKNSTAHQKAFAAWAVSDYWEAMGRTAIADCMDKIAEVYYKKWKQEKVSEQ